MTKTKPFSVLADRIKVDPVRRARMEEHRRAIEDALTLARLRDERGLTQTEVAAEMTVSQRNVSRIEHQEDVYLSTLRNYVAALGGQLEITAVFPDRTYALHVANPAAHGWVDTESPRSAHAFAEPGRHRPTSRKGT